MAILMAISLLQALCALRGRADLLRPFAYALAAAVLVQVCPLNAPHGAVY